MKINFVTIFPELFEAPLSTSIPGRIRDKGLVEYSVVDLRDFTHDRHRTVDDTPYGGGAGMVMRIEPIARCIEKLKAERDYDEIIFLTPDGELLNQGLSNELSMKGNLMMLCGHYKGVDERLTELYISREISIGDYVLSGGELGAAVLADSIVRLIPGVLGDETSALSDSFQNNLLSPPVYTRPREFKGLKVPDILLSGHQARIDNWKLEKAIERTRARRPDLLDEN